MKVLLVGWVLLVVTLAIGAVAATNWYEYGALNADRGVTAERGWEPFIVEDIGLISNLLRYVGEFRGEHGQAPFLFMLVATPIGWLVGAQNTDEILNNRPFLQRSVIGAEKPG